MSSANAEQIKAINHSGGVLLSAGAGSGKTFVLVEHVTYLVQNLINQYWSKSEIEFTKELKKRFASMVVMTFTKKATGELAIRLQGKLQKLVAESEIKRPWEIALQHLDYLTVTTIHGFCLKLIRQGHFINAPEDLEIISDNEQRQKVKELYLKWLDNSLKSGKNQELLELILRREKEILSSFQDIFADAALRMSWKNLNFSQFNRQQVNSILSDILEDLPFKDIFKINVNWGDLAQYKDKDWYDYVNQFEKSLTKEFNLEAIHSVKKFFAQKGKPPTQPRTAPEDFKEYYQLMRKILKFVDEEAADFLLYDEHFDTHVLPLLKMYRDIFVAIDSHYYDEPGLVFSDLETLTYEGVSNQETAKKISEIFNYFIIDEFQDTSRVQFSIIEKIIQNDYSKIFCVGDLKQAIYGFRGGELGVFQDLMNQIPQNLKLTNNYRSKPSIIKFNNSVFEFLFQQGLKFEGIERNKIAVDAQTIPEELALNEVDQGKLYKHLLKVPVVLDEKGKIKKLSNSELNFSESLGIVQYLQNLRASGDDNTVAILYRKLAPVNDLIKLLMKQKISFTAQVKIPFLHDPIIGIFRALIEGELEDNASKKKEHHQLTQFLVRSYLYILKQEIDDKKLTHFIEKFAGNRKLMGLQTAFWQFLFDLGIANSNYQNNLKAIKGLIEFNGKNLSEIWMAMESLGDENYSIDFQFGDKPNSVIIMTAHASKGLEFPHVILAGIHTNGQERPDSSYLGKNPGSFKWKLELKKESEYKTPQFWHEDYITEHKNFAESKRLFYVAATRAKENLIWFDFENSEEICKKVNNSWIIGLRKFEANHHDRVIEIHETIKNTMKTLSVDLSDNDFDNNPPHFFHQDPLGLAAKNSTNELLVVTDLSVTRLASLAECPRKFYLKNICKISDDEANIKDHKWQVDENENEKLDREEKLLEENKQSSENAMGRGTFIHLTLSNMIKRNWVIPRTFDNSFDLKAVEWVTRELMNFRKSYQFISEEPIKFPVFGHMISGTPDLILIPLDKNSPTELAKVWDFKTGKRKPTHEINYWFQLYLYAFAIYELELIEKHQPIELTLAYVDQTELVSKKLSFSEINELIKTTWNKLDHLDEVNQEHCERCPYQNLCF